MLRILLIILILKGTLMAIEEPKYTVIEKNESFELRRYTPYVIAQTKVSGSFDDRDGEAFKILFKYISGENEKHSKIKMTAPVMEEMNNKNLENGFFSFVMPQEFSLSNLPIPLDKAIVLKTVSAKTIAVRRYSGGWGEEKYKKNEAILLDALKEAKFKIISNSIFARYNSPFSLWFMRRNEIMIEIRK